MLQPKLSDFLTERLGSSQPVILLFGVRLTFYVGGESLLVRSFPHRSRRGKRQYRTQYRSVRGPPTTILTVDLPSPIRFLTSLQVSKFGARPLVILHALHFSFCQGR